MLVTLILVPHDWTRTSKPLQNMWKKCDWIFQSSFMSPKNLTWFQFFNWNFNFCCRFLVLRFWGWSEWSRWTRTWTLCLVLCHSGGVLCGEAGDPAGEGEPQRRRHRSGSPSGLHRRPAGGDAAQRAQTARQEVGLSGAAGLRVTELVSPWLLSAGGLASCPCASGRGWEPLPCSNTPDRSRNQNTGPKSDPSDLWGDSGSAFESTSWSSCTAWTNELSHWTRFWDPERSVWFCS